MALYNYRAVNDRGRKIRGTVSAQNEVDLYQRLHDTGLELIDCSVVNARRSLSFLGTRIQNSDLIQFCVHISELLRSGVPLLDALSDIRDSTGSTVLRDVMNEICRDVGEGSRLSVAFGRHPKAFSFIFVALIAAGEQTGNLNHAFSHLADHIRWTDALQTRVRKAARYPLFTLFVTVCVIFFMMLFVVPEVMGFIKSGSGDVPLVTRSLIGASQLFADSWALLVGFVAGSFIVVRLLARFSERCALWFDDLKLRIPIVGPVLRKIALSRFAHFFAVMFGSGIEILRCLESSKAVIGNRALASSLDVVQGAVRAGNSLSAAMANSGEFPALVVRMVKVGEESGNLGVVLEQVTEFYDREVNDAIDGMIAMIEPTMTLTIGLILGWVVMGVFGPLYNNLTSLGG